MDVELLHDVVAVRISRLGGDLEQRRDLLRRLAFRDQLKHLSLAQAQQVAVSDAARIHEARFDDSAGDSGAEIAPAAKDVLDRLDEVG